MRHAGLALLLSLSIPLAADLRHEIVSRGPGNERVWVGYTIPASHARHVRVCCSFDNDDMELTRVLDDAPQDVSILYAVRNGEIISIRMFSSCLLDRARVQWLDHVDPADSIALLSSMARSDSLAHQAIAALALHENATDALIDLAHHGDRAKIRSDALFWLAETAAEKAGGVLRDAVDNDPDEAVRAKAVFGIAQLPDDQSIPLLDELMRTHKSAMVRKKAAFWLGQKNDPRALAAIESFLRH